MLCGSCKKEIDELRTNGEFLKLARGIKLVDCAVCGTRNFSFKINKNICHECVKRINVCERCSEKLHIYEI